MNNYLLATNVQCLCELTNMHLRPCNMCGRLEYSPDLEKQRHARKEAQDKQRQAFLKRYDPEHNNGDLPF